MGTEPNFQCGGTQLEKAWHLLDLARREINHGDPNLALNYLRSTQDDVEQYEGTPIWAEHRLLIAEVFATLRDPVAESLFQEAVERISKLPPHQRDDLELRAKEHFGDFLVREKRSSRARPLFEAAKLIAARLKLIEDSARIELKIIRMDQKTDDSLELPNFMTMKQAAKESGYSFGEQLAVWHQYRGEIEGKKRGMTWGRQGHKVSKEYFAKLLKSVSSTSRNEEED